MVMAHLFTLNGHKCAIAHCNFMLRDEESNKDEELVRQFAEKYSIPIYIKRFDTEKYASENKTSIQIAARELRYAWFNEIKTTKGFDEIAIAHNADDNIETFFINLIRGSGLKGLSGITAHTQTLVRPIIHHSRAEIDAFAQSNNVLFREDESNSSTKYLRNKLRHLVLPVLDEIDSQFRKKATESINYLAEANKYIEQKANNYLEQCSQTKGTDIYIPLSAVYKDNQAMLFYVFEKYGFKGAIINNILNVVDNPKSGKQFHSSTHCILIDRTHLIISPVHENFVEIQITETSDISFDAFELKCETVTKDADFAISQNDCIGEFDYATLKFPLTLRLCKSGDWFIPLGMSGRKKLSDFFIDKKVPLVDKKKQFVIVSEQLIIWIVGLRQDERFKITDTTKQVFRIIKR